MTDIYGRLFEIFIGDRDTAFIAATDGRQFKVVFKVLMDFGGFNSYAEIGIYNLSRDTEARALKKGEFVGLRAGYADRIDYIFRGEIVNIIRAKAGPNIITKLFCKGGALSQKQATINQSFGEGVTPQELIKACADALGFPLIIRDVDFPEVSPYISGYSMTGSATEYLNRLSRANNFKWMIENERLIVVGADSFRNGPITAISSTSGMVGVPEITEVGADVVVRLDPSLIIGGRFQIESSFAQVNFSNIYFQDVPETFGKGIYRIQKIEIDGDSYGEAWNSRLSGIR